jgi:hypothetical protein
MKYDKKIFMINIKYLTDTYCQGIEREFNDRIGQRDALTRWKKPHINPNFDAISKICEEFDCSFDWLLTGKESKYANLCPVQETVPAFQADPMKDVELKRACQQVKNIILSDHPVIKPALLSNLAAFEYSIEKENDLFKRIEELEKAMSGGRNTDTDAVASSNIGKRET